MRARRALRASRSLLALCATLACQAGAAQPPPQQDRIECAAEPARVCRVSLAVYVGWRVFQAQCASCHGAAAAGSSFAPDLTERLRRMEQRDFFGALDRGYFGPGSAMPPRGRDPNVSPYYEELWAYLTARRDGRLPAGPVERLPVVAER
jgi:cytochrome c5